MAVKRGPGRPKGSGARRGPGRPPGTKNKLNTAAARRRGRPAVPKINLGQPPAAVGESNVITLCLRVMEFQADLNAQKARIDGLGQQLTKIVGDMNAVISNLTARMNGLEMRLNQAQSGTDAQAVPANMRPTPAPAANGQTTQAPQ